MRLVHITTVPETFGFFRGQIAYMKARGFEVHGVSSPGELLYETGRREAISVYPISMKRRVAPFADLVALTRLYRLFRRLRPEIVHAHTPKGGLLGVVAARLARVPVVVYGMRGLPHSTSFGLRRLLLCWSETLSSRLADRVMAVSRANLAEAVAMGFCLPEKIKVIGSGSSNGVDAVERFNPQRLPPGVREKVRNSSGIPINATVVGFVGRIVRDKGIIELEEAWSILEKKFLNLHLLLVGPMESQDPVSPQVIDRLQTNSRVYFTGRVKDPAPLYAAMDIFVLPTHREGFPNTPLEAAAMELPVVATRVDGCGEAVVDGVTGFLVPHKDGHFLAAAIEKLLSNLGMGKMMGHAGRQRVLRDFKPDIIWEDLLRQYDELIKKKGISFNTR